MTKESQKILKDVIKNEISPLLIGLRNEIEEMGKIYREGQATPVAFQFSKGAIEEMKHHDGKTPVKGFDYFTDDEATAFLKEATPVRGRDYFTAKDIADFKEATTPIKGKDYFDGTTPIKGTDYFTDADIKEFLSRVTPIKGIHYRDGIDGLPGEKGADGTKITAEQIRNKLETLKGSARLSISAIKGLKEALNDHLKAFTPTQGMPGGMGGSDTAVSAITGLIAAGTNVTITGNGTIASPYRISASGGGGGSVSFGTTTQIPYMNAGGTDFLYSANLTYNGSVLALIGPFTQSGDQAWFDIATSNFKVTTTTYGDGLIHIDDTGIAAVGDWLGNVNGTSATFDDTAQTASYVANNGHTFYSGNVGINTPAVSTAKLLIDDTTTANSGVLAGSVLSLTQTWNTSGHPTAIKLNVTNTSSGANARLMDLQVAGVSQFNVSKAGAVTTTGILESASQVRGSSFRITLGNSYIWNSGSQMKCATDGIIQLLDSVGTSFTRLQFGGTTSSFPAIKRSSATLAFRLADDSADAAITAAGATLSGATTVADTVGAGSGSLAGSALSVTQTWNTSGAPTALKLNVTNTASGAAALLMDLQVGGVSQFSVSKAGAIVIPGNITLNTLLAATAARVGSTGQFYWNSRSQIFSPADGQIRLTDAAGTSFSLLQFGGTTSSFPSIKRSSAALVARLADDSANADFTAARLISTNVMRLKGYTVATLPGTPTQGDTAYCTDLLTPTFFTAAVGGGAVVGPVFYNGTIWITI